MRFFTAFITIAAITVGTVRAQDCSVGVKPPESGSWAEYTMAEGAMRLALLGRETRAGKDLFRVEMTVASREGPMIMQVLVPGYPYEMSSIEDVVIKPGNGPAMRLNAQMMGMMRGRMPKDAIAEACRNNKMARVGEESVTVPAGTFRTVHYRDSGSGNEVWVSEGVPFGMVRTRLASGEEIVLKAKGAGATSQITEKPQEMGMPN